MYEFCKQIRMNLKFLINGLILILVSGRAFAIDNDTLLLPDFLDDVSLWHSEVNLHEDYTKFEGKYIDGLAIGNGLMLAVEGMTTGISRFNKSRLTDSRFHGLQRFGTNSNGFIDHLSRSPKLPLHYMQWIAGPIYTKYPIIYGLYFTMDYSLPSQDKSIQMNGWNHEEQYRIRNTNIVKNVLQTEDVQVTSVDFMLPDHPVLIRRITISNTGKQNIENAQFYVTYYIDPRNWTGSIEPSSLNDQTKKGSSEANELDFYIRNVQRTPKIGKDTIRNSVMIKSQLWDRGQSNPTEVKKLMLIYSPEDYVNADKQFMQFDIRNLTIGESRSFNVIIITVFDEPELLEILQEINNKPVLQHLVETYKFWKNKINEADKISVPFKKDISQYEKDYIDNIRLFLLSCYTKSGGSIAHPYSYNAIYFRDSYDTYRAMLSLGHQEECKNTLLFFKEAMNRMGIRMSYTPTEFLLSQPSDISKIGEASAFSDFTKSEYMLFFPVMVRDYINKFPDDGFTKYLYPEIKASLKSQPVDGEGLIAYSGDEISVKRGARLYRYSPQNAALYVTGASFMADIADKLGERKDAKDFKFSADKVHMATEKFFWNEKGYYVYSVDDRGNRDDRLNIFSQALPFFYGYLNPDDKRLSVMIKNTLQLNTFSSFRVSTLPFDGRKVCLNNGNTIGLLLYMMSLADHPDSRKVFKRMMGDAGTMGTTGEYLLVSNDWISRGEMLRPYETSFNLIAALEYLKISNK